MKLVAWILVAVLAPVACAFGNPIADVTGTRQVLDPERLCYWTESTDALAKLTWGEHEFTGLIRFEMRTDTLFVNEIPVPILVHLELVKDDMATAAELHAYADYVGKDFETWVQVYRESPLVDSLWTSAATLHVLCDSGQGFQPTWEQVKYREGLWSLRCRDVRSTVLEISERLEGQHDVSVIDGVVQLDWVKP